MGNFQIGKNWLKRTPEIATLALGVSLLVLVPACLAQATDAAPTPPPPPTQTGEATTHEVAPLPPNVVRLSDVEGTVQILRDGQVQFSHAVMNMPLMQGSRIDTGADGRAEIEFEDGSVARITPSSSLLIRELKATADGSIESDVEQLSGLIYYELRSDPHTPFKVGVGGGRTATPAVNSTFRVDLTTTPPGLAVLDGKVQVTGAAQSFQVDVVQGKTIQFATSGSSQYTIADWVAPNGFDDWNTQRDQEAAREAEQQTPARVQQGGGSIMDSGIGWSDLDNAGGWYPLPGYGMVWQPYGVGPGFDPYGDGMWADFGGGFGYTWISGYPWGWLPFNYGMWSYIGGFGWGWMPGPYIGFGYGYGGYGYRGRGYGGGYGYRGGHHHPYTNVYRGPAGYRAPVPPTIVRGQTPSRIVRVGNQPGTSTRAVGVRTEHANWRQGNTQRLTARQGNHAARTVRFNGEKIAPLHSMMTGVTVPVRNAALYNNYSGHGYRGDMQAAMWNRSAAAIPRGSLNGGTVARSPRLEPGRGAAGVRAPLTGSRSLQMGNRNAGTGNRSAFTRGQGTGFNTTRGESFGRHSFGAGNRATFGRSTSFGPSANFGGTRSATFGGNGMQRGGFQGGSVREGGFRGGSVGHADGGGFHGGGFQGGAVGHAGGGGFQGGGAGGGSHAGGGGGHVGR